MTQLWIATLGARLLLATAYILVSGYVISLVINRTGPPAPTAAQDLNAGHELTLGDLETEQTKALVNRHLRKEVDKGKPITADMVSPTQLPAAIAPTIAAIVTMPQQLLKRRNLVEGSTVEVQLANSPQKLPGKIAKLICDDQTCSVIVSLAKVPPSTVGPADFASADVVPPSSPSPQPPAPPAPPVKP